MAEVAAGAGILLAAEEVLSTTAQAGVATYFLTKPTQPLKATFTRVAVADDSDLDRRSLTRSNHSLTIINDKAYIFGGTTTDGKLATNDVHVVNLASEKNHEPEYQLIPAITESGSAQPEARSGHASCAFKGAVAVYGGADANGRPIEEGSVIRLFHPETKTWDVLEPRSSDAGNVGPGPRIGAKLFVHQDSLIVYCSNKSAGEVSNEVWVFDATDLDVSKEQREKADKAEDTLEIEHNAPARSWSRLPNPPVAAEASNAALYGDHLYVISSTDAVSSQLHILPFNPQQDQEQKWTTLTFPTNPIIPGPRARHGGALVPVTTGYGRNYLIYLLGAREQQDSSTGADKWQQASIASDPDEVAHGKQAAQEVTQWSDTWTLQLPSSSLQPKPALNIKDAIKPAKIKDAIRSSVGAESGKWSWSEVEVQVPNELGAEAGKLHPGPRAFFGADVMDDGQSVIFWGGEGADGEKVGDGWVLRLS